MEHPTEADEALVRRIEGESRLLREAILMVAGGGAPRVVVAGLHLARAIVDDAERLAVAEGVRVVPLWTADEQQFDVRVERVAP
jgi:hypothetical protein